MLTFVTDADGVLEVNSDNQGRLDLLAIIDRVREPGDHEHAFTPAWGGDELTEERPNPGLTLVHKVTFQWVESGQRRHVTLADAD